MSLPMKGFARVVGVALLTVALASCGIREQTQGWYTGSDGVHAEAGDISLRNTFIVADEQGNATLLSSLANTGVPDKVTAVVVDNTMATLSNGPISVADNNVTRIPDADTRIDLTALPMTPGHTVDVEFRFANAPRTTVTVPVLSATDRYADVEVTPSPTATPDEDSDSDAEEPGTEEPGSDGEESNEENMDELENNEEDAHEDA